MMWNWVHEAEEQFLLLPAPAVFVAFNEMCTHRAPREMNCKYLLDLFCACFVPENGNELDRKRRQKGSEARPGNAYPGGESSRVRWQFVRKFN
jgi:hypothetical protein